MYSDIFNNVTGVDENLGFNPNWNYMSPFAKGNNYAASDPRWGVPQNRSVGAAGNSWMLSFVDRPVQQVNYIQRWYEQFQRGYFTIVEYDNYAREHVGRFTAPPRITPTANMKYNIGVPFTELQGTPMRNYPAQWWSWSHPVNVIDDYLNPQAYTYSAAGVWSLNANPTIPGASITVPSQCELISIDTTAGDYAVMEYVGWGFQMVFRLASSLGICDVLLDGNTIATGLDLSNGTAASLGTVRPGFPPTFSNVPTLIVQPGGASVLLRLTNVTLGRHRIQVTADGTKNAAATSTNVIFPNIQVIH